MLLFVPNDVVSAIEEPRIPINRALREKVLISVDREKLSADALDFIKEHGTDLTRVLPPSLHYESIPGAEPIPQEQLAARVEAGIKAFEIGRAASLEKEAMESAHFLLADPRLDYVLHRREGTLEENRYLAGRYLAEKLAPEPELTQVSETPDDADAVTVKKTILQEMAAREFAVIPKDVAPDSIRIDERDLERQLRLPEESLFSSVRNGVDPTLMESAFITKHVSRDSGIEAGITYVSCMNVNTCEIVAESRKLRLSKEIGKYPVSLENGDVLMTRSLKAIQYRRLNDGPSIHAQPRTATPADEDRFAPVPGAPVLHDQ